MIEILISIVLIFIAGLLIGIGAGGCLKYPFLIFLGWLFGSIGFLVVDVTREALFIIPNYFMIKVVAFFTGAVIGTICVSH